MPRLRLFILGLVLVTLAACGGQEKEVAPVAEQAVQALKARDMNALANLIHPAKGVHFAPYATLSLEHDRHFTPTELRAAIRDSKPYVWGEEDGSGAPVTLSFRNYFDRFVYDRDFAAAKPLFNADPPRKSNSADNARQLYPTAVIVTYHAPATTKNGMDFRNLRLVFERFEDKWVLVHIAHDQWTI